ncbi:MAG TPA: hypothetical protein VGG25_29315 [Streptosporangiaceae bacterium]|jgi:hypothetical protein
MTANADLGARARAIADKAPRGSLTRQAAGCCAVAFGTTATPAAARKVLDMIEADDIKAAAAELVAELLAEAAGITS